MTKQKINEITGQGSEMTIDQFIEILSKDFRILTGLMLTIVQDPELLNMIAERVYPKYVKEVRAEEAKEKSKRAQLDSIKSSE